MSCTYGLGGINFLCTSFGKVKRESTPPKARFVEINVMDFAPVHLAMSMQKILLFKNTSVIPHLSHSFYSAACDCFLFPRLKSQRCDDETVGYVTKVLKTRLTYYLKKADQYVYH